MKYFLKTILIVLTISACNNIKEKKEFYSNGELKIVMTTDDNGLKQGVLIHYFKTGSIMRKETYKNDTLEGQYITYFKNGKLKAEAYFKKGILNGVIKEYFENGQLNYRGNYTDSLRN